MIDFEIKNDSKWAGRLNFQIGHVFEGYDSDSDTIDDSHIDLEDSIVITEDAFSLIESCFSSEFPEDDRHRIYYHHGAHLHSIQSIKSIIDKLIDKKVKFDQDGVSTKVYYWFEETVIQYLNANRNFIYNFIDNVVKFLKFSILEIKCKAIYVVGI